MPSRNHRYQVRSGLILAAPLIRQIYRLYKRDLHLVLMNQSGRSDCLYSRIMSTVHHEVAACDPGGAIRNEESDDLCDILRNAHSAQRNRGSHGLRGNALKSARTTSAPGVTTLPGVTVFTRTPCDATSVASVLLHAFIAAFADE